MERAAPPKREERCTQTRAAAHIFTARALHLQHFWFVPCEVWRPATVAVGAHSAPVFLPRVACCGFPSWWRWSQTCPQTTSRALMSALGQQPVSVALEADKSSVRLHVRCVHSNVFLWQRDCWTDSHVSSTNGAGFNQPLLWTDYPARDDDVIAFWRQTAAIAASKEICLLNSTTEMSQMECGHHEKVLLTWSRHFF